MLHGLCASSWQRNAQRLKLLIIRSRSTGSLTHDSNLPFNSRKGTHPYIGLWSNNGACEIARRLLQHEMLNLRNECRHLKAGVNAESVAASRHEEVYLRMSSLDSSLFRSI